MIVNLERHLNFQTIQFFFLKKDQQSENTPTNQNNYDT